MSFINQWRVQLPGTLAACRTAIKIAGNHVNGLDLKYGVFAAGLLWPVREAGAEDEQRDAVREVCGGKDEAKPLLRVIREWQDYVTAASELTDAIKENDLLIIALEKVIAYFQDALLDAEFMTIDIRDSTVQGAIVNIGGKQFFYGDVAITIIQHQESIVTCPPPPAEPIQFGGREKELSDLCAQLRENEPIAIIAVSGLGGIGKTTLARKLANILYTEKAFRAVLWASITRNPDPLSILQVWAKYGDSSYSLPDVPPEQIAMQVKGLLEMAINTSCEHCESDRILVVLDDVWDDQDGKGRSAVRLLQSAAPTGSTILLTTRSENLAIDLHARTNPLDRMSMDDGLKMLHTYEHFSQLPDESLRALATALGGHPLAIDLAARRIQKAESGDRVATLSHHIKLYQKGLSAGSEFRELKLDQGDQREDNLTTVLSYSYHDLAEPDRVRFRALGILPPDAPMDRMLLASLWNVELDTVPDYSAVLRLFSLLQEDLSSGTGWYKQHPLLRSYALALLRKTEETDDVFTHYAEKVIQLAEQSNALHIDKRRGLLPYLPHIQETGNGLVARTSGSREPTTAIDYRYFDMARRFLDSIEYLLHYDREYRRIDWLEMGVQAGDILADYDTEIHWLIALGLSYVQSGNREKGLLHYEHALLLSKSHQLQKSQATLLNNIGRLYQLSDDADKAIIYYQQALELQQGLGITPSTVLNNIALIYTTRYPNLALHYFEQALSGFREQHDLDGEAHTLANIASVHRNLGNNLKALEYHIQALELSRTVGDKTTVAAYLNDIAFLYGEIDEPEKALDLYAEALQMKRSLHDPSEALTLHNLGLLYESQGRLDEAIDTISHAIEVAKQTGYTDLDLEEEQTNLEGLRELAAESQFLEELSNTVVNVKTLYPDELEAFHKVLEETLQQAKSAKNIDDQKFFKALLSILEDKPAVLPEEHPYHAYLERIQKAIDDFNTLEESIYLFANNTIAVKTDAPDDLEEWRRTLQDIRTEYVSEGETLDGEVEYIDALLAIVNDQPVSLSDDNRYQSLIEQVIATIRQDRKEE